MVLTISWLVYFSPLNFIPNSFFLFFLFSIIIQKKKKKRRKTEELLCFLCSNIDTFSIVFKIAWNFSAEIALKWSSVVVCYSSF